MYYFSFFTLPLFSFFPFRFLCMTVLPVGMYASHTFVCCPQSSEEGRLELQLYIAVVSHFICAMIQTQPLCKRNKFSLPLGHLSSSWRGVCVCACVCLYSWECLHDSAHMWRSEDNYMKFLLPLHRFQGSNLGLQICTLSLVALNHSLPSRQALFYRVAKGAHSVVQLRFAVAYPLQGAFMMLQACASFTKMDVYEAQLMPSTYFFFSIQNETNQIKILFL